MYPIWAEISSNAVATIKSGQGLDEVLKNSRLTTKRRLNNQVSTLLFHRVQNVSEPLHEAELDGVKVMHTTEFLIENGFDMNLKAEDETTVTFHDRLSTRKADGNL